MRVFLSLAGLVFILSSASWATSCPHPTQEVTYTTCPVSGVTEISVKMAPFCATGAGNATNDDTYAIQNALNAGLTCRIPVVLPSGYYYVSKSIYVNGHGGASTQWQTGGELRGTGYYSEIIGNLTEAYPVLDATGFNYGKMMDLTVVASGQATSAILLGVPTVGNSLAAGGNTVTIERVSAGGGTIAGVVDLGSDLLRVEGSDFSGPTALIVTAANIVNIASKFNTSLVANNPAQAYGNGTLARITDTNLEATSGASLWIDGMDAVTVSSSYFHLGGTASAAIKVTAQKSGSTYVSRGNSLYLYNERLESDSTAASQYFLDLQSGVSSQHGTITGIPGTGNLKANIHLPAGASMLGYDINFTGSNGFAVIDGDVESNGAHSVGSVVNSTINVPGSWGYLGAGSMANNLIAYYQHQPWSYPAGAFNSIVSENVTYTAANFSPATTDVYSLGDSSHLFTAVYAKNGTIQTSDARQKKNITNSDLGLDFINGLRPVSYRWKSGTDTDIHYGLIAQETEKAVAEALAKVGRKPASDEQIIVSHDSKTGEYGMKYNELISPVIKAVQEIYKKVTGVESLASSQAREIASVKAENDKLKSDNAAMKSYLCGKDPSAPICR